MLGLCMDVEDPVLSWGMEINVCKKLLGNHSGIIRQHLFGALWGEYVKTSTFIWSSFVFIYISGVFLVGVNPVGVELRFSLSLSTVILQCHWLVVELFIVFHYLMALYLLVTVELLW